MARPDRLYLVEILAAADDIAEFLEGFNQDSFSFDKRTQAAVMQRLMLIGEASKQLSQALKVQFSEVPWTKIIAFRNFVIHEYFSVDWDIVWVAASDDVVLLRHQIGNILEQLFPD